MNMDNEHLKIFEKLLDGEEKVTFFNESIEMKKLRELESKFKPDERKLKNVIVFWDDMIQFTTLGLIDSLLDHFDDIENKEYDFDKFFYRGFEDTYYVDFVKRLFKEEFNKELENDFIIKFHKENYSKILLNSPASSLFHSFIRCEGLYENILLCFRFNFDGMEEFSKSLNKYFTGKFKINIRYRALEDFDNDEFKFLLEVGGFYNIYMIQNMGKALDYLDESKHYGVSLVSPNGHNGVSDEFFITFFGFYGNNRTGPYNSEITIFNEGISIC